MTTSLIEYFSLDGIDAMEAGDSQTALRLLSEESFDAVVSDLRMPGQSGLDLLRSMIESGRSLPFIMMSAHGEVSDAVAAMKSGAFDYLVKPFDPEELVLRLRRAVAERRSTDIVAAAARASVGGRGIIGESRAMKEVFRLIDKAGPTTSTILITGESGTGKEVAARSIHEISGRDGPFVPVNVGSLPESLLESELFGHERGAYTGADSRRPGLFEAAEGGTLFLDEIGELPLHLQVKLLRAIQEKKIQRLGGVSTLPVNIRFLAATNRDLETEVKKGRFREDLYYRLNVIRIHLPPLREREGDRSLLAAHYFAKLRGELGRKLDGISPEALARIEAYRFPGNVRELANLMERAMILAEGNRLEEEDFTFDLGLETRSEDSMLEGPDLHPRSLAEIEKTAICAALRRNAFRREKTARELGITRRTLLNKINEYSIDIPAF
jgi:two-component system response regulator AtoC